MTKFEELSLDDFMNFQTLITTRETYLEWVQAWKINYYMLTRDIRAAKLNRKPFLYEYRAPGMSNNIVTAPRRTQIGPNPNYKPNAAAVHRNLREDADMMMQARAGAKAMGIARKKAMQNAA